MFVASESELAERAVAMGKFRKKLANRALGVDIDELCLEWYNKGLDDGFSQGVQQATNDIVTDLLSDALLSLELDVEMMQRIIDIVEN